ncbi:GPP34 family phosphoprotein [Bacteroidota bacterium]
MELQLFEKFILVALDQKKGKFLIDSLSLNYGLAGSILLELSELNKIIIKNKRIVTSDKKLTNNLIIDTCIKLINSTRKDRKPRYWIYKIGNKSSKFRKIILKDLYDKRIIRIDKKEFLWGLITIKRYPVINPKEVNEIKSKLKRIVLENEKSDIEAILLLSLMASCKLTRILFATKKEHRAAGKRIKELTNNIEISEAVSQTLREIQAAIIVATTSTFVSSTSN